MSPLRVSEKTLELNVGAEILRVIRLFPGCRGAFWIGMKQDQEARLGIDELIHNVPSGIHFALQFKAPRAEPPNYTPYRFTINDRQNNNLLRLAIIRPQAVHYIFPHYNTFTKMRSDSPDLLRDSWLLNVYDLWNLPSSTNRLGTHTIESDPPFALVYSEPMRLEIVNAFKALKNLFSKGYAELESTLIRHSDLRDWLRALIEEARGNKRAVGQRLRGFSTFCIS